jgi:hypothetical protein
MKNAATGIGLAILGIGIAVNGLNLSSNQANATTAAPVAFNAGPAEPTIVWYGSLTPTDRTGNGNYHTLLRAWSDGTVEGRRVLANFSGCLDPAACSDWVVIASPNEGLNAAADINHDEIVNAADIGLLVAAWGDAPRNPMPPSDCPLGLIQ